MTGMGLGDLAQHLALRRQNAQLKAELARVSNESATGKAADLTKAVSGDHRATAALNRSLTQLGTYKSVTTEAGLVADSVQTGLTLIQGALTERHAAALSAGSTGNAVQIATTAREARTAFASAVAALNVQVAGRPVFSGTGTASPLPDAEAMLSQLAAATAGADSADEVVAAVTAWFETDPAGYDGVYRGSATALAPVRIGEAGQTVQMDVTALDPAIRDALRGLALAALADGGPLLDPDKNAQLMTAAGEAMANSATNIAALSARVGILQGRIETAATRNSAETSALTITLSKFTEVDSYDSATMLTAVEGQQKTLYAVTARLSALSLLDYLR